MGSAGVVIRSVMRRHEAELMKLHLEAAGIKAWLSDEGIVGAQPLLANAVGGIKVHVAPDEEEQALAVLDEIEDARQDGGCLSCGAPMAETDEKCAACGWTYL